MVHITTLRSTVLRPMLLLSVSGVSCRTTLSLHGTHHSIDVPSSAVVRVSRTARSSMGLGT